MKRDSGWGRLSWRRALCQGRSARRAPRCEEAPAVAPGRGGRRTAPRSRVRGLGSAGVALVALCLPQRARAEPLMRLPRLTAPITLDGAVDEAAWRAVAPVPVAVYEPAFGGAPSQVTEIRVAHDDGHLYLAARLFDAEPAEVRAHSLYRDESAGDDTVGLIVDPFNDDTTALWFYMTPTGTRVDGTVTADMASGDADWSWNGRWEAAARRTSDGWSAEMRVPFSTLGFQSETGDVTMGLSVYRWLARHNERHVWPRVPPRWSRTYAKPSRLRDVALTGVASRRALTVTPYALLGYSVRTPLDAGGRRGPDEGTAVYSAGVDVKYGITSNLTLDVTLNTDFAQVKSDDEQINLTRFPLFLPEKRQFFLERAGIFEFNLAGDGRLFHSRRIGLVDGEPVALLGGARLVGRVGRWDIGARDLQTAQSAALPSENFGVLRLRRQLDDPLSGVGGMLTSRVGVDGRHDVAYGADATLHVVADEFLTLKLAHGVRSARPGAAEPERWLDGGRILAAWERRRAEGFSYRAELGWAGAAFDPGIGFEPYRGYRSADVSAGYEWQIGHSRSVRAVWLYAGGEAYQRHRDGLLESALVTPSIGVTLASGDEIEVEGFLRHEEAREPLRLAGGIEVPEGRYAFHRAGATLSMPDGRRLRCDVYVEGGSSTTAIASRPC
ncbi:carbohydrate binding family 9 domain-containing protein [Sorangium cellulosum]|uniref:carbohydrate binding family 9 domain-containing protein n=1 Tax=Sorangium cellulosum TaxID=56 RepID=UPI00101201EA|nr:carbohydrate binding family 9 domain-containing protein [Sorangium cellulosum]